jgi:hypothetical protein
MNRRPMSTGSKIAIGCLVLAWAPLILGAAYLVARFVLSLLFGI